MIVDCHSHLYPRAYLERLKARTRIPRVVEEGGVEYFVIFPEEETGGRGRAMDESFWSVEAKLAFMDRIGIDRTVVSLGNPWLAPLEPGEDAEWARLMNAEFAAFERATAGRVAGLGVLPASDVAEAVRVVGEIAVTPTLRGIVTGCRLCGLPFDDARLEPVWAALADTRLPLFVHPHDAAAVDELGGHGHVLPLALGFPFETTIALARLVLAGVLVRHPGLRILAAHGGGTLPYLAARLDVGRRSQAGAEAGQPSHDLSRLYLDAVLYHPRALRAAADLVGVGRMVFGTDHPFFGADQETPLRAIEDAFGGPDLDEVLGGTATVLFGP